MLFTVNTPVYRRYLMFSIDKADSRWQLDGQSLQWINVSTALNSFTGNLREVGELGEDGIGDAVPRFVQEVQDTAN